MGIITWSSLGKQNAQAKEKRIISYLLRKVASLAQLLLDPYFRTVSGFQVFAFYKSVSSWEFTVVLLLGLHASALITSESFRSANENEDEYELCPREIWYFGPRLRACSRNLLL